MSNLDNNANSSQYPLTDTNMFVHLLANSDKLQSEDKRYQYNGEKSPELDDDHSNYISERNNSEHHTDNNTYTQNTDTKNTDTRNTDTRNSESYNNTQTEKKDSSSKKDEDENLTPEELMLRKLDMLRKLSELAQAGVKLSQNYNMNSDYKMMKYEYELHKGIRAKQNGINWMSSMSLNLIYGIEMLNEKYNPFDLKLKGWSEQMNADVNNYYDVFGELYEKYNQPGKNMAPELKLLLMVSGSALKFHLTNTMMSNLPTLNTQLDEDPVLAEQLRQKAIAQKIKEQSVKNNEALKQAMTKEHHEATQKAHDLNLIRQKELELQNLKRENAQKNAELEAYKEKLLMSQTQQNTNLNKAQTVQQPVQQPTQQQTIRPTNFPIPQPTNLSQNNVNNTAQQQMRVPPAVQRMMMMRQNQQVNFEDQMKQQFGLNNNTIVTNKLETLQAQANYMEELEKLKLLRIQKEKELEEEKRKNMMKKVSETSSETSESSKSSKRSSETSKSSKSSVEYNINLKTILSDSKNKMLDITSSDKIKNLGTVSKDEISKSNISLGKKRVKKDKESKDSGETKETKDTKDTQKSDKQKVVKQKKTGISLF
jgi:hypothetical protein